MKKWLVSMLVLAGCQRQLVVQAPAPSDLPAQQMSGGGTDVGSGGDNHAKDHLAAWFLGEDRPIAVCFEIGPEFGADKETVRKILESAFAQWGNYIKGHNLYPEEKAPKLSTKLTLSDVCDGKQELAVYLGVENAVVKAAKGQFDNPTAFVQRTHYDPATGLGRGFIYVSPAGSVRANFPDWKREGRLEAMLLHEIGHIYGNDHVPGTIMAQGISELLAGNWAGEYLARIDHCRELTPCYDCDYYARVHSVFQDESQAGFFESLGVKSKGDFFIGVSRNFVGNFLGMVVIEPELKPYGYAKFLLANRTSRPVHSSGAATFKIVQGDQVFTRGDVSLIQYSTLFEVPALKVSGMMILEYNMASCQSDWPDNRSPLEASFVRNDEQHPMASFGIPVVRNQKDGTIYPPALMEEN